MKLAKHLEMWLKPEPTTQDWSSEMRWICHGNQAQMSNCWGHLVPIEDAEGETLWVCSKCGCMEWDG